MIVEDYGIDDGWPMYAAVAQSALTFGTLEDVDKAHTGWGAEWPVSGDATTRAGGIVHRRRRHSANCRTTVVSSRRRGVAGGWLRRNRPAAAVTAAAAYTTKGIW